MPPVRRRNVQARVKPWGVMDARRGGVPHVRVDGVDTGTSSAYSLGNNGDVAHLVCAIERVKLALLKAGNE